MSSRPEDGKVATKIATKVASVVIAAAGLIVTGWQLGTHYPLGDWLIWRYLGIWAVVGVWMLACLSGGHALLARVRPTPLPLREHAIFAFAAGVLIFITGVFLIGLLGALGAVAFVVWPAVLLAAGALPVWRLGRRAYGKLRAARLRSRARPTSPVAYVIFACGALGVVALYINILTPSNLAYDSHWYHMAVAEHYSAAHAIRRFPEGWFAGALPQLATLIYTWAFLLPGSSLFMRIELGAHLEFALFVVTLASIPLLVRWLMGGVRTPLSWVALFLFPGIFVYDSSLSGAADHILAFWAVPMFLALVRFWRTWTRADAWLLAIVAAGAALTKYQSVYMLAPVGIGLAVKTVLVARRRRPVRVALAPPAIAAAVFALVTSTHWLKNLLWYGDPAYPLLHAILPVRPWNPDANSIFQSSDPFKPLGTFGHRLLDSAQAMVTFAFYAHDWPPFHRDWPTFGFIFTLLLPFLLVLKGASRLRALGAAALLGVFMWYWTFHEIRYLQSLVPWMAAFVAALLVRMWQTGLYARAAVVPLVVLQIFWGGDHYFLPTHAMSGSPLRVSMDLIASGYEGRVASRTQVTSNLIAAGETLPRDARVLIHEQHTRLGLGVQAVSDNHATQAGLSYRRARSPRELWLWLRRLGVTHVLWLGAPMGIEAYADEAVFYDFVTHYLGPVQRIGGVAVAPMTPTPPSDAPYRAVALQACQLAARVSLPEVDTAIYVPTPPPTPAQAAANQVDVDFFIVESACRDRFPAVGGYDMVTARNGWETWSRRK